MEKAISSDLIRGHIDTIILYSLKDGDKFAQQISDSVEKKSGNQYEINQATLYSSLKRLENLKYVEAYWNDSENGRRRFFRLTDLGNQTVENNLSNWAYSRAIIDKLMDTEPDPIVKTEYVEKIVTVSVPADNNAIQTNKENSEILNLKPQTLTPETTGTEKRVIFNHIKDEESVKKDNSEVVFNNLSEADRANIRSILFDNDNKPSPFAALFADKNKSQTEIKEEKQPEPEKIEQVEEKTVEIPQEKTVQDEKDTQEINFRNILNGLIITSTTNTKKQIDVENVKTQEKSTKIIIENDESVKSFNDTLIETEYNAQKSHNHSKIDFGDLAIEAAKEGYKLRISSKEPKISKGAQYKNKLNLCASLLIYLVVMLEFLYFSIKYNDILKIPAGLIVTLIILFTAFPTVFGVFFYKDPQKTSKPFKADVLLTVAIVIFNLLLITFAGNLLFGTDFSDKKSYLVGLIIPLTLYLDVFFFYFVKFIFSKHKMFLVSENKK